MIRFDQVSKRYPNGHQGLDNLSFHIRTGEMVFITGHSGAGKSTLLKLIMCMERPSSGHVFVGGQNLKDLRSHDIPYLRRQVGVVFQNHQLLFDRTVFDNVALPLIINGTPQDEIGRRVRAALDKVGLLKKESLYPSPCPVGSSSGSASPGRWCTSRRCCWPTSPPATWTRRCRRRSWPCSRTSTGSA